MRRVNTRVFKLPSGQEQILRKDIVDRLPWKSQVLYGYFFDGFSQRFEPISACRHNLAGHARSGTTKGQLASD
jgi:hypothetical protein